MTWLDARWDPAKRAGFSGGDLQMIRKAGVRAGDDAIRSLVIYSRLLGAGAWFLIHQADCGMETFTKEST